MIFLVSAATYLVYVLTSPRRSFYFDANNYWRMGDSFFRNGYFSFTNFDSELRGYAFPLFASLVTKAAHVVGLSEVIVFKITASIFLALFVAFAVPALVERVSGVVWHWWNLLLFHLVLFVFWRGWIEYPLTDFPSVLLLCLALICALSPSRWSALVLGFSLALLTNLRPVYEIVWIPIIPVAALTRWRNVEVRHRHAAASAALFILGAAIAFLPQIAINRAHFHTSSPLVQAKLNGGDLYLHQLFAGIRVQKYDTSIGGDYPSAGVVFADQAGYLMKDVGMFNEPSYLQYAKTVILHPFDAIAIYGRHVFNALDLKYDTPYVERIYDVRPGRSLLNYFVIFCAVVASVVFRKQYVANQILAFVTILAPVAVAIPTAIEPRFFLPLHLTVYAVFATIIADPDFARRLVTIRTALVFGFFATFCFVLSSNALASIQLGPSTLAGMHRPLKLTQTTSIRIEWVWLTTQNDLLVGSLTGSGFSTGDFLLVDDDLIYPLTFGNSGWVTFSFPARQIGTNPVHSLKVVQGNVVSAPALVRERLTE